MRIISKSMLVRYWESRRHDAETAKRDLKAWITVAEREEWANFAEIKQTFGSADRVGNCVVFDIGNNRFRLITRVMHRSGIVYTLRVMDHEEYNKNTWKDECRCYKPPAQKKRSPPSTKHKKNRRNP